MQFDVIFAIYTSFKRELTTVVVGLVSSNFFSSFSLSLFVGNMAFYQPWKTKLAFAF